MKSNFQLVLDFHKAFNLDIGKTPKLLEHDLEQLRLNLLKEEYQETLEAVEEKQSVEELVKEITDCLVVAYGFLVCLGVDGDKAFQEVMRSNMSKLDSNGRPTYRADGKVLKGDLYKLPDNEKMIQPIEGI